VASRSEIQYASVAVAAADNTIVAAVTAKRIRVHSVVLVASGGAITVAFESGTGGTAITGDMDIADNGQLILPHNPAGWFQTAAGALLNLEMSATTAVAGCLTYTLVE
jgi:hypothetical protein